MNKENNRLFLNEKPVPLFNLSDLLKGYNPEKEGDVWDEKEKIMSEEEALQFLTNFMATEFSGYKNLDDKTKHLIFKSIKKTLYGVGYSLWNADDVARLVDRFLEQDLSEQNRIDLLQKGFDGYLDDEEE